MTIFHTRLLFAVCSPAVSLSAPALTKNRQPNGSERVSGFDGLNLNHSNADWEVGWFAKRSIALRFIGNWQRAHGGLSFSPSVILTPDEFDIHDRVARARYLQLGAGVTFSVNRSLDLHTAWVPTAIYARDTHGDKGFILGFSWRFSRGSKDRISANTSPGKLPTIAQWMF